MSNWGEISAAHVRAAIAECDRVGSREFLTRYRLGRARDASLWHGGQEYDARALMSHAFLGATGRTVPSEEFALGGEDEAVHRLKELGFDVVVDETLTPPPPKPRKAAASRSRVSAGPRTTRAAAAKPPAPKRVVVKPRPTVETMPAPQICPTCFMALPATGICDNCD